jgi:hypothetical protein
MRTNLPARIAAVILLVEAAGLVALTILEVLALVDGDAGSVSSGAALIVLTLVGAAALAAFGIATWRGASWGRSGGIVTQALVVAIGIGTATGEYADPVFALLFAAPAVVAIVLLIIAARRAGRERERDTED